MSESKKPCDLCSLPVEITGFSINTKEGERNFCCEGCRGIYTLLNTKNLLPDANESEK